MSRIPRSELEPMRIIGTRKAKERLFSEWTDEGWAFFDRLWYRLHKMNQEARPFGLQIVAMIPDTEVWVFDKEPEQARVEAPVEATTSP